MGSALSANPLISLVGRRGLWEAHRGNGIAGVGFEFSFYDPFCGVDLDKCLDPDTGKIEPWAWEIIKRLDSYTEVSPSGRGVHILVRGKLPPGGNRKGKVELYSQDRYFTMTGTHLEGTPTTIEPRQAELEVLHREIFGQGKSEAPKPGGPSPALDLTDSELIDKAKQAGNGISSPGCGRETGRTLRGARFVKAVEVEGDRRMAEVVVKQMTGGDTMSARFLHQEWFSFKPAFKIFLGVNHKPVIRGTDHAICRRILLNPFTVQIPFDIRFITVIFQGEMITARFGKLCRSRPTPEFPARR